MGEVTTVDGPVVSTYYATESRGKPTFLNIGLDHPDRDRVTVLIWDEDRSRFTEAPEEVYRGETVCVTGRLDLYRGVAEILVDSPSAIRIVD